MKEFYTYILTNKYDSVLYVGVTKDLRLRLIQHRDGFTGSFSSKYRLCKLVYFERSKSIIAAIKREKQLKNWHREWKMNLIREINPEFVDISDLI